MAGATQGIIGQRRLSWRVTKSVKRYTEAGFCRGFADRFFIGHS